MYTYKRIAIFTEYFDSSKTSAGQHMTDLTIELSKNKDFFIDIYTFKNHEDHTVTKKYSENIKIHRIKNGKKRSSSLFSRAISEILISFKVYIYIRKHKMHRSFDNIIWYSPTIFWGPLVMYLKLFNKTKNILILRDIFPRWAVDLNLIKPNSIHYYFFRFFELLQYRAADIIAIQADGNKDFFGSKLRNMSKIITLKTWYHPVNSLNQISDAVLKKIPFEDKKICVYAGNLGIAQNQELLLKIVAEINQYNDDHHFIFIGLKNSDRILVEKLAKKLNLTNFTSIESLSINELNAVLDKSHMGIFSLDSRHTTHNIPGKFLHYISLGIPSFGITNENNDLNLIMKNNNLGNTYSGHNSKEAAIAFLKLSKQISNEEYTKDAIKKYVTVELAPKKAATKIINLFNSYI